MKLARRRTPSATLDLDRRVPADSDRRVPADSDRRVPADSDRRVPGDSDRRVPGDSDRRVPGDSDRRVPADSSRRVPADSIASAGPSGSPHPPTADPELLAQRDRLIERFAAMQSELGGLFYEMAIRDHVRMDLLIPKAAELQRVDAELGQVRRLIETGATSVGGSCRACGAVYARGAAFCAQCAEPLAEP